MLSRLVWPNVITLSGFYCSSFESRSLPNAVHRRRTDRRVCGFEIDCGNVTHLANTIECDHNATPTSFLYCAENIFKKPT